MNKKQTMPHWYKERRTTFQNNIIYHFLRICGYESKYARRMMHWSIPHIILNIKARRTQNGRRN